MPLRVLLNDRSCVIPCDLPHFGRPILHYDALSCIGLFTFMNCFGILNAYI